MSQMRHDDDDDIPRRRRHIQCHDGYCGAEDCPNCHPENFRGGKLVRDDNDDEPEEKP